MPPRNPFPGVIPVPLPNWEEFKAEEPVFKVAEHTGARRLTAFRNARKFPCDLLITAHEIIKGRRQSVIRLRSVRRINSRGDVGPMPTQWRASVLNADPSLGRRWATVRQPFFWSAVLGSCHMARLKGITRPSSARQYYVDDLFLATFSSHCPPKICVLYFRLSRLAQKTRYSTNASLILARHRTRWASIKTTLVHCLVFVLSCVWSAPSKHETFTQCGYNVGPESQTMAQH